jgi:biopolymer transport protein ExbB/TolQ
MFDTSTVAIGLALVALWLGVVAMWLVADFSKRVIAEAKQLIDASTTALWKSVSSLERNAKIIAANQQEIAGEVQRLRESLRDVDTRTHGLHARAAAHRQEIDRIHGRITQITRVLTTLTPVPEFQDDVRDTGTSNGGESTFEKLQRASADDAHAPNPADPLGRVRATRQ